MKKSQIFSFDVIIAVFVFIMILISSIWLWDTVREKLYLAEKRNSLEIVARNAIYSLTQTVGDPPNWNNLPDINDTVVYSLGIAQNRPWIISENKTMALANWNDTRYNDTIKRILTVRGPTFEFFLNVSKFNYDTKTFSTVGLVGIRPNSTSMYVIRLDRFGISDVDGSWMKITLFVHDQCYGVYCN